MMKLKKVLSFFILLLFAVPSMAESNGDSSQENSKPSMEWLLNYAAANKDNHGKKEIAYLFELMAEYLITLIEKSEALEKKVAQLQKNNSGLLSSIEKMKKEKNTFKETKKPISEKEEKGSINEKASAKKVASTKKQRVVASLENVEPEVITKRELVAPSLFESDGTYKPEMTFTPAVVYGRVNLLNSRSTKILVRGHELFVGLAGENYSVNLHKAYTLYVDKKLSEICDADKENSQPGTENNTCSYQNELIQSLASPSHSFHGKTWLFLDKGDGSNNYHQYICDQDMSKSLNITKDSILKCKYISDNYLPLDNETINTSQNRNPSNLLKTFAYAAYLNKRSNKEQPNVNIDYDVPTSYLLYSKNVTEEEYNHQILLITSNVIGFSLNTKKVDENSITNDKLKKVEKYIDSAKNELLKCRDENHDHDARIPELIDEVRTLTEQLNRCS